MTEPEMELPQELVDVPVEPEDQWTSVDTVFPHRQTTCILHWIMLICMVVSIGGGLLRLAYLLLLQRRDSQREKDLEKAGFYG